MAIDRIEVFITELPQRVTRRLVSGIWDTGAPKALLGKPVLVRVYADGVCGTAQIRPLVPSHIVADSTFSTVAAIREVYAPLMIGKDLFDLEQHHAAWDTRMAGNPAARAALDHAVYDAMGRALGVPVYKLLGGLSQPKLPLEWSVGFADKAEDMIKEASRAVHDFGLKVICLKGGHPEGVRTDLQNFEAVRKAMGPDVMIGVDPNEGWTVAESMAAIPTLKALDIGYLEQPIQRRNHKGLAMIRAAAQGIPIMADESVFTLADAIALAEKAAVDVFCIKLYKMGGITQARKIAAVAEAADIQINAGAVCAFSQLEAAASGHFYSSFPKRRTLGAAEFVGAFEIFGPDPLVPEPLWFIRDGCAEVPNAPGLGVNVDERRLEKYTLLKETIK